MTSISNSARLQQPFERRGLLKGISATAALTAVPGALAACSNSTSGKTVASPGSPAGPVTFGSNYSDASTKAAFAALCAAATAAGGPQVTVNTVNHNTFQTNITSYLQGTPDDLVHLVRRLPHADYSQRRAWPVRSTTCGRRSAATSARR